MTIPTRSIWFVLAVCLGSAFGSTPLRAIDADRIKTAIDLAADHLVKMQNKKGLFQYDVNLATGRATGQNNIVRQVGTVFSLAEYLGSTRSFQVSKPISHVLTALQKQSVVFRRRDRWIVASNRNLGKARAGATALALLTEILYFRATGDGRFEAAREGWLKGLLALRLPRRGFRSAPYSRRESPYFNGEIWLALAHYYDTFRDPKIGKLLDEVDRYMVKTYTRRPNVGFYHWGVMAAAIRYENTRDLALLKFIEKQTSTYLLKLRPKIASTKNTCYALEGLLTASAVLNEAWPSAPVLGALSDRLDVEIPKNLDFQLVDVSGMKAPKTRRRSRKPVDFTPYKGLFVARADRKYGRIDYTQHCLSAFVKLYAARLASQPN